MTDYATPEERPAPPPRIALRQGLVWTGGNIDVVRADIADAQREALEFVLPLHEMASAALPDRHGDVHREAVEKITESLRLAANPEEQ